MTKADCNNCDLKDIQQFENKEQEPQEQKEIETVIPFWFENPNVILHSDYIYEIYPQPDMTYNQMLNAVTRSVMLLAIIVFLLSPSKRLLFVLGLTMGIIFLMYYYHEKNVAKDLEKEAFTEPVKDYLEEQEVDLTQNVFEEPSVTNPFGNVLISDYHYNTDKKPAPPSYNENVQQKIFEKAKNAVQEANPDHPGIADKLFKGLGEEMTFEQSLRPFNSNPSTTIPNDQGAFADFCYGSMVSCKEGNQFACARNHSRYTNY